MKNRSGLGRDMRDEEVAALRMPEAEYDKLLRQAKPLMLHPSWASYQAWVDQLVQKGIDYQWEVEVYECTAEAVLAFWHTQGGDLQTRTLTQYALELRLRKMGKG